MTYTTGLIAAVAVTLSVREDRFPVANLFERWQDCDIVQYLYKSFLFICISRIHSC